MTETPRIAIDDTVTVGLDARPWIVDSIFPGDADQPPAVRLSAFRDGQVEQTEAAVDAVRFVRRGNALQDALDKAFEPGGIFHGKPKPAARVGTHIVRDGIIVAA